MKNPQYKRYTTIRQIYAWIGFIAIVLGIPTGIFLVISYLS